MGSITPTYAAMRENDTTWWSVEEMIDFYYEVEAEKEAVCGDDQNCKMEFGFSLFDRGEKYQALQNFTETQIWLTSVNPGQETIKVFYFDDDTMLKHMGIEEKISLEHLYFGWVEDWHGQIFNYDHDYFNNGGLPGNHPMYDGSIEKNGKGWLPAMREIELSVSGSELINNSGRIDYAAYAEYNKFNAQGSFDYSNCLRSPDYELGTECKMYISADQWVSYFPPREDIISGGITLTSAGPDWPEIPVFPDPDPEPIDPEPTDPEPTDPEPYNSEPVDPEPTYPEPTEPDPTDPEPTNPDLIDPEPTISEPSNPEPTDPEPTNPEPETPTVDQPDPGQSQPDSKPAQPEQDDEPDNPKTDEPTQAETDALSTEQKEPSGKQTKTVDAESQSQLIEPVKTINNNKSDLLNISQDATNNNLEAPNTGKNTEKQEGNHEEALIPLIMMALLFAVCWFLPTKSKKERKKYEKSVDKNSKLR